MQPTRFGSRVVGYFAAVLACALFLAFLGVGCDDSDSYEARLEEARIAVDGGDYDTAIAILSGLEQTGEVLENLSTAYAGKAGVDSLAIYSGAADGGGGTIDQFGRMLGQGDVGLLACSEIAAKLSIMDQAIAALISSAEGTSGLSDYGKAKLGIYGLTDAVLILGQIFCRNFGDRFTPPDFVGLTEAWIKEARGLVAGDFVTLRITPEELAQINRDVGFVSLAAAALGPGNVLGREFEAFLGEIDTGGDGDVSFIELIDYVNTLGE